MHTYTIAIAYACVDTYIPIQLFLHTYVKKIHPYFLKNPLLAPKKDFSLKTTPISTF